MKQRRKKTRLYVLKRVFFLSLGFLSFFFLISIYIFNRVVSDHLPFALCLFIIKFVSRFSSNLQSSKHIADLSCARSFCCHQILSVVFPLQFTIAPATNCIIIIRAKIENRSSNRTIEDFIPFFAWAMAMCVENIVRDAIGSCQKRVPDRMTELIGANGHRK